MEEEEKGLGGGRARGGGVGEGCGGSASFDSTSGASHCVSTRSDGVHSDWQSLRRRNIPPH